MIIDKCSSFLIQNDRNVKCPTSRIDCEMIFLSILENFFQSDCIFPGKSISGIYNVLEAITKRTMVFFLSTEAEKGSAKLCTCFPTQLLQGWI